MPALEKYARSLPYTYAPGLFPTMEALNKRPEAVSRVLISGMLNDPAVLSQLETLCAPRRIRIERADKALSRISGKENCFAAAVVGKVSPPLPTGAPHLVLHHPSDRGNLGTMLRSALGFGYGGVAVISPCADIWDPHVVRASMGAVFSLSVAEYEDIDDYRRLFPCHTLYPFMLDGSVPLDEAVNSIVSPYALVMGNEGAGLPPVFKELGIAVRIPHSAAIDSLNLGVAASIGMYAFSAAVRSAASVRREG